MTENIVFNYEVPGDDFTIAGEAASKTKKALKKLGVSPDVVRKVSIAMYEGEINMVIHANGGTARVIISSENIEIILHDNGPGIEDIDLAMKEGYSTATAAVRNLGFGAGMGLPNMKKHTDSMRVESAPGEGTTVYMTVNL